MTAGQPEGVPFVWSFEGSRPGPHLMIAGLTHGNEPAGRDAVLRLVEKSVRPLAGRLTLALVNPAAAALGRRFVDRDMNRLWRDDWLDEDSSSVEAARARELRPLLRQVDVVLDLHTTTFVARPFFVIADLAKTRALADRMAWPPTQQLMPGGCVDGRHLTDYGRFSDPGHPAVAVTVECGTHDAAASAGVALEAARRFLDVVQGRVPARPNASIERFRTKEPCVALTDRFVLRVPSTGFVAVRQGEVVAMDGGRPVEAPGDLVIVSPRPDPRAGQTAFLWCERC
jgi:predicted deacylase